MNVGVAAPVGVILLGLLLGMRHATDPDHVVAVTAILSRERRFAAALRIGVIWGLGHTATVLAVGVAIIIFKVAIPTRIGLAMEFAVAIVLILLGLNAAANLARRLFSRARPESRAPVVHSHSHAHKGRFHSHPHVHPAGGATTEASADLHMDHLMVEAQPASFAAQRPMLRSFAVGLVHGLAGSAAIALLVLSAIPSTVWATAYLAIFCVGVIIGMGLITTAIGLPFVFALQRMSNLHRVMVSGAGLLSFGFGLFLALQIGVGDHLFGAAPIWIPH
jgi:hypothetical protein